MRLIGIVILIVAAFGAVTTAECASISGTVNGGKADESERPQRYVGRMTSDDDHTSSRSNGETFAVVLESLDQTLTPTIPDTPLVMAQHGMKFEPKLLVVPVGGQVSFPNLDPVFHNVFSYSSTKTFDLGRYPAPKTKVVIFEEKGTVRIFCEIHSEMYASVVVIESPYWRLVNPGEKFDFDDLAPGRYRLRAINAHGEEYAEIVKVHEQDKLHRDIRIGS